jgi:hypothetical protein
VLLKRESHTPRGRADLTKDNGANLYTYIQATCAQTKLVNRTPFTMVVKIYIRCRQRRGVRAACTQIAGGYVLTRLCVCVCVCVCVCLYVYLLIRWGNEEKRANMNRKTNLYTIIFTLIHTITTTYTNMRAYTFLSKAVLCILWTRRVRFFECWNDPLK